MNPETVKATATTAALNMAISLSVQCKSQAADRQFRWTGFNAGPRLHFPTLPVQYPGDGRANNPPRIGQESAASRPAAGPKPV
jgi:hypothetical protein